MSIEIRNATPADYDVVIPCLDAQIYCHFIGVSALHRCPECASRTAFPTRLTMTGQEKIAFASTSASWQALRTNTRYDLIECDIPLWYPAAPTWVRIAQVCGSPARTRVFGNPRSVTVRGSDCRDRDQ